MSKKEVKKTVNTTVNNDLPLSFENYRLMIVGFVIIIIGFVVMSGGPGTNEEIYSFRKITLAPIIVLAGFLFEIYAIMKKPKEKAPDAE